MTDAVVNALANLPEFQGASADRLAAAAVRLEAALSRDRQSLIRPWLLLALAVALLALAYVYARYVVSFREMIFSIGTSLPKSALLIMKVSAIVEWIWPVLVLGAVGLGYLSFRSWRPQRPSWTRTELVLAAALVVLGTSVAFGVIVVNDVFAQLMRDLGGRR